MVNSSRAFSTSVSPKLVFYGKMQLIMMIIFVIMGIISFDLIYSFTDM